jgi:preprotein translocase subunit SecD
MENLLRLVALTALLGAATLGRAAAEILPLDVAKATVTYSFPNQSALDLQLTPAGGEAFAAFTQRHVGKTIDLVIDGKVVISPRLAEPITGGRITVSGAFAPGRLEGIARKISAGTATVDVATRD